MNLQQSIILSGPGTRSTADSNKSASFRPRVSKVITASALPPTLTISPETRPRSNTKITAINPQNFPTVSPLQSPLQVSRSKGGNFIPARTKTVVDPLAKLRQISSIEGPLKKKRKGNFWGVSNQSKDKYFGFLQDGRIFAYWEVKPTGYDYKQKPKWITFTRNILDVEENYKKKKGHFMVKCSHTKNLHLKHDKSEEADRWVAALIFLSNHYKFSIEEPWEVDDYNCINPRVMLVIMMEMEKKCWPEFHAKIEHFDAHRLKGVATHFEIIGYKKLERYMVDSTMKKCYVDQDIRQDSIKEMQEAKTNNATKVLGAPVKFLAQIGLKVLNPKALVFSIRRYAMLITAKGVWDENHTEKSLLTIRDLPHWMNFDKIYMYPFSTDDDNSPSDHCILTSDILCVEAHDDTELEKFHTVRVECADKVWFFACDTAHEARKWIDLIRKSKENSEELVRLKYKEFKLNIDPMIHRYRYSNLDGGLKAFADFSQHVNRHNSAISDISIIMASLKGAIQYLDFNLDAIQAKRPFYRLLHKCYLIDYHLAFYNFLADLWNKRSTNITGIELMMFIDIMHKQNNLIAEYGMRDCRFQHTVTTITSTFCMRIFKVWMPMILEVLTKIKTDWHRCKDGHLESNAPVVIFKLLNEIVDHWFTAPYDNVLRAILSLCFKLIANFQYEFRKYASEAVGLGIEVLCLATNSNLKFVEAARDFVAGVATRCKKDRLDIELMMSYSKVLQGFGHASNDVYVRIQKFIDAQLMDAFLSIGDYKKFQISQFLESLHSSLMEVLPMLFSSYAKKLWKFIWNQLSLYYIQMIIFNLKSWNPDETSKLSAKIAEEMQLIKGVFSGLIYKKKFDDGYARLMAMAKLFNGTEIEFVSNLGFIRIELGDDFNEDIMRVILSLRLDLSVECKKNSLALMKLRAPIINAHRKTQLLKIWVTTVYTHLTVKIFTQKLKSRVEQSKLCQKAAESTARENSFLFVSSIDNEKKDMERDVRTLCGQISMTVVTLKTLDDTNASSGVLLKKSLANGPKFTNRILWFSFELLCWKDRKKDANAMDGRIWMASVNDIKICEVKKNELIYVHFKHGSDFFILQFFDEKDCRHWAKAIAYQNYKYRTKTSKIKFDSFEGVSPDQKEDDFFRPEPVNYCYTGIKYDKLVEIEKRKFDFSKIKIELDEKLQKIEDQIASIEGSVVSFSDFDESYSQADVFGQGNQVADLVKDMMSSDGEDLPTQSKPTLAHPSQAQPTKAQPKSDSEVAKEEKQRRLEEARKAKEREARARVLREGQGDGGKGKKGFFGKVFNWF